MPKGVIQDWGLVEFFDPEDTEATQTALNGSLIHGHSIRIHFCIPGVNAINIYMQASKKAENTKQIRFLRHTIERKSGACSYSRLGKSLNKELPIENCADGTVS